MQIDVDRIETTGDALYLGLVIRGPGNAWVRFSTCRIPYDRIPYEAIRDLLNRDSSSRVEQLVDDTLDGLF